jgi:hypothetical protein
MILLVTENVKTYCITCDAREVASPVWSQDIVTAVIAKRAAGDRSLGSPTIEEPPSRQVFALGYRCQRCRGEYDAYLVRRLEWKLSLEGRSPMEHIEVPGYVPKTARGIYRDALVALHGGKTPAAFFYLRAFIEQFARRQTGIADRRTGQEIFAAYAMTIPPDRRGTLSSLQPLYDQLGDAIHTLSANVELFEQIKVEVDQHFDIRRVFKIPDHKP